MAEADDGNGPIEIEDPFSITGVVTTRVWNVDELEQADPEWSDRPREERHALLCSPSTYPTAPTSEGTTTNIVVDGYLEALAAGEHPQPTHLAFGDGTATPAGANEALNNEVYRTIIGPDEADGRDRLTSTFLSQNEANGLDLREIGFTDGGVSDDWTLLTHAVLATADRVESKTSNMTVTFNYSLMYRRVS